jgi:hypothetical protein
MQAWNRGWGVAAGLAVAGLVAAAAWTSATGAEAPKKGAKKGAGKGRAAAAPAEAGTGAADAKPETTPPAEGRVYLRVDLKSAGAQGKKEATAWDGALEVSGGRLVRITSWGRDPRDAIDGASWKVTTRRSIPSNTEQRKRGHELMPLQDSALLIELEGSSDDTRLAFTTKQGDFAFALGEVPPGVVKGFSKGMVNVARAAGATTVLSAPTEDDMVAAAASKNGAIHVAYVAFTHGPDFRRRGPIETEPKDFALLAQPTGGDQVMVMTLADGRWTGPVEVTPKGGDVFRPAVAVDGDGATWVFWTAKSGDRWDLFSRRFADGKGDAPVRLTDTPGPDAFPSAATDAGGRVWVAWMAFGAGGQADILAARQDGAKMGKVETVCGRPGNQWGPSVAASADGRVAVAWDSYEAGTYDVFARVWSAGAWADPVAVAATARAEMRPSAAFDPAGRLWIAYEDGPENWGKDWGALDKAGAGLQSGRSVSVRVLADGRLMQPVEPPAVAFGPGVRGFRAGAAPGKPRSGVLAQPVIACDAAGRVWLSVRSSRAGQRVNVGSVWFDHVAWYAGDRWSDEIIVSGTDNTLDSAPALVPWKGGGPALVCASDGRMATAAKLPDWFVRTALQPGEKVQPVALKPRWPDPVNNELAMALLPAPAGAAEAPRLEEVAAGPAPAPSDAALDEAAAIGAARAARAEADGKPLRLLRGEFHRHTELSSDGGGDGMLMDMWRYGFDAAGQDWIGNGDHDNGGGREYPWWITQKNTDLLGVPGHFAPMYTYERSCNYPDGHRNAMFARRGVRTLPRLKDGMGKAMDDLPVEAERPNTPDTQMLYRYLGEHDGICASHTSGTDMGTDWRDNNPKVEPVVEIYQGCRQNYEMPAAPRANTAEDSIGGWRPYGFVSHALKKGYRLGFQSSSDHGSTHISYCCVWAADITRDAILAALKARHVYGATDNIIADVRCGTHFMGDEFTTAERPTLAVKLRGTAPFARVHIIKDGAYVHSVEPKKTEVEFQWTDMDPRAGATSYYYVRGEQEDGELVWVSPMWITYRP